MNSRESFELALLRAQSNLRIAEQSADDWGSPGAALDCVLLRMEISKLLDDVWKVRKRSHQHGPYLFRQEVARDADVAGGVRGDPEKPWAPDDLPPAP